MADRHPERLKIIAMNDGVCGNLFFDVNRIYEVIKQVKGDIHADL